MCRQFCVQLADGNFLGMGGHTAFVSEAIRFNTIERARAASFYHEGSLVLEIEVLRGDYAFENTRARRDFVPHIVPA